MSNNIRKLDLREAVHKHLAGRDLKEHLKATSDPEIGTIGAAETLLSKFLAKLIGLSEQSIARDQALVCMKDSINIFRLQAGIQRLCSRLHPVISSSRMSQQAP